MPLQIQQQQELYLIQIYLRDTDKCRNYFISVIVRVKQDVTS